MRILLFLVVVLVVVVACAWLARFVRHPEDTASHHDTDAGARQSGGHPGG
jgi:hypothetical protein